MSKHTPGPWHITGNHPRHIHIGAATSAMVLATMNNVHVDTPANARLISASPDMLSALQNLENDNGAIPAHAWELVQSAIRKATSA